MGGAAMESHALPAHYLAPAAFTPGTAAYDAKLERMQEAVRALLEGVGEQPQREGLLDTPKRVAKAFLDMTIGYRLEPSHALGAALFHEPSVSAGAGGLVLVRDIDFASTSDECLLPFHGRAHVAYLPGGGVVLGLSKLARVTRLLAKRVQSQERLAADVLRALSDATAPRGVAVVIEARHLGDGLARASAGAGDDADALLRSLGGDPLPRYALAVEGCFAADAGGEGEELLMEVGEMLYGGGSSGVDLLSLPRADLGADVDRCCGASDCSSGAAWLRAAAAASSSVGRAARPAMLGSCSSGLDSPLAPATPDPSEGDSPDEDEESLLSACGSGGSSCGDAASPRRPASPAAPVPPALVAASLPYVRAAAAAAGGGACCTCADALGGGGGGGSMEAAVRTLLAEAGVLGAEAGGCCPPRLAAAARRYVLGLLASTSGYHEVAPAAAAVAPCSAAADIVADAEAASPEPRWRSHHVRFASQCEHHMLPFYGSLHVAYLLPSSPSATAASAGLSDGDVARLVGALTRRLQLQERITQQVADAVAAALSSVGAGALGAMVVARAAHMCMVARGVENHAGSTVTRAVAGAFAERPALRARLLREAAAAQGRDGGGLGVTNAAGCSGGACCCSGAC